MKTVIIHKDRCSPTCTVVALIWRAAGTARLETILFQVAIDLESVGLFRRRLFLRERWCCDSFTGIHEQEEVTSLDEGTRIALRRVDRKYGA